MLSDLSFDVDELVRATERQLVARLRESSLQANELALRPADSRLKASQAVRDGQSSSAVRRKRVRPTVAQRHAKGAATLKCLTDRNKKLHAELNQLKRQIKAMVVRSQNAGKFQSVIDNDLVASDRPSALAAGLRASLWSLTGSEGQLANRALEEDAPMLGLTSSSRQIGSF